MERGYVLHHRPYRESSALVNLLVDGKGRVDAVARVGSGKRSIKSILQPFQPVIFTLSGASELKKMAQIEAASPAIPLANQSLYAGMYLNELLVKVVSSYHQAELFQAYHQTLLSLASEFKQSHLRYFEYQLLLQLGAMPSIEFDTQGDEIQQDALYRLLPEQGFMLTLNPHRAIQGDSLIALTKQQINEHNELDLKNLMRTLLTPLLGNKPLLSRKLFTQYIKHKC
ncbi:MAG: DNA repair protein RecO [Parashewanella sp.]